MAKHIEENPEDLAASVAVRHETRDLSNVVIRKGYIYFLAFFLITIPFSWMVIKGMDALAHRDHSYDKPMEARDGLPGGPLLQTNETAHKDIADLRAEEEAAKTTYRSVPNDPNHVSVPIDRAITSVAAKGLPNFGPANTGGSPK